MSITVTKQDRVAEFLRLHTRHEARVHAFILSLLPNWSDAEEVMQETVTVLWGKFDEFQPDSNYFAWACQIARFEVSRYLRRQHRHRLEYGPEVLDLLTETASEMDDELAARQHALAGCVEKLSEKDRHLVVLRYRDGLKAEGIAGEVGRSVHAVYKAMKRIRRVLYDCVAAALAQEGTA